MHDNGMNATDLLDLSAFPRARLGHFPTPFEPLAGVSRVLGGPSLFAKRDDCTGLAFGGSKVRKLEYSLGAAVAAGADAVLVSGSIQSNQVRLVACAAARLGLRCVALLEERIDDMPAGYRNSGNVLLDRLFGADVRIYPKGTDLDAALDRTADELRSEGGRVCIIRGGAPSPDGVIGYAAGALELQQQAAEQGLGVDWVVMASESAGLQAGFLTGYHALGIETRVLGVSARRAASVMEASVHALAVRTSAYLGLDRPVSRQAVEVDDRFVGPGYGRPAASTVEAMRLAARHDGLALDPVYAGKAFAGLIAAVREHRFRDADTVVFLHSGGSPLLFAYAELLDAIA